MYQLRVAAGRRSGRVGRSGPFAGRIELYAGETLLAGLKLPEASPGEFRDYSLQYQYDPVHQQLSGQPLRIRLLRGSENGLVDFDHVRLYVEDPEVE